MKIGVKNVFFVLLLVAFLALAYFAVSSRKTTLNNSIDGQVSTSLEESEEADESQEEVKEISLEVTSPKDGDIVKDFEITVKGKSVAGAEVFINDVETKADTNGKFEADIVLEEGENDIYVVVNDSEGNYAETNIKVILNTE